MGGRQPRPSFAHHGTTRLRCYRGRRLHRLVRVAVRRRSYRGRRLRRLVRVAVRWLVAILGRDRHQGGRAAIRRSARQQRGGLGAVRCDVELELELELIQYQMTQKPMLRCEVGARSLRASSHARGGHGKASAGHCTCVWAVGVVSVLCALGQIRACCYQGKLKSSPCARKVGVGQGPLVRVKPPLASLIRHLRPDYRVTAGSLLLLLCLLLGFRGAGGSAPLS